MTYKLQGKGLGLFSYRVSTLTSVEENGYNIYKQ